MTRTKPEDAVAFLRRTVRSDGVLESAPSADALSEPPVTNFDQLPGEAKAAVEGAVAKLDRPDTMTPPERMALEAIIIPDRRPAINIANDDYVVTHRDWLHLNADPVRARIKRAIPAIGRLEVPSRPDLPYGGTAFLVGPNLVMTNRHVAELFVDGTGRGLAFRAGAQATMNFVEEAERSIADRFAVRSVVVVHPYWDMALLRIEDVSIAPLLLSLDDPASPQEDVVVIGFPAFNPRLDRVVQDEVFGGVYNVKRLQPGRRLARRSIDSFGKSVNAATHDASTLGGNSGSAVIAVATGQVVGLHFGGAYLDTNYAVPARDLALDARLVDAGISFASASEPASGPWDQWWRSVEAPATAISPASTPARAATHSITVPLTITVSLGDLFPQVALGAEGLERAVEPWHDVGYDERKGYDPHFLGFDIPLPELADDASLARLSDGSTVIPYMHFSIAMDAVRRLARFTASNVRADAAVRRPEAGRTTTRDSLGGLTKNDTEKWFLDPRLRGIEQLPDRFFTKDRKQFDKGHLVRRDDVAWGETFDELRTANGDTYHMTNCSPQIAGFNRPAGLDNWGDLEKAVLAQATDQRLSIFAGPVLDPRDPLFDGFDDRGPVKVRIPRAYWKLIVAPDGAGLGCYAFLLEQDLSRTDLERIEFDADWQRQMVGVAALEEKTGLTFPAVLHDADRNGTSAAKAVAAAAGL